MFFQWECLFFWPRAFCKTVLCRFFIWIYRVFSDQKYFFNESVCFFGLGHFEKVLKNWFLQLLARSWFWRMLFSIQILIQKVLKNWFFQLLARSWFWRMLFSIQILIYKVLKNWFFQLLARSWFWWMIFLIQTLTKKVLKKVFFQLLASLGFGECFFLFKF